MFTAYQQQVLKNAQACAEALTAKGIEIVSGGTDNHLMLVDLRSKGVNGNKTELVCDQVSLILNKNTVPGDRSAMNPSGLRVGTPAMTSRGLVEEDFKRVGEFIAEAVDITAEIQKGSGKKLSEFKKVLNESPPGSLLKLKNEVEDFATRFEMIG